MKAILIQLLTDFQVIVTIIIIIAAYKWGDWRHWKKYYPTMLYFAVVSFLFEILTYNHTLWAFDSPLLKVTGSEILITMVFFPATFLIYLAHFPRKKLNKLFYVLGWVLLYTLIERISLLLGFFIHRNGWNIWWSLIFNIFMFPLFIVHYKNPPLAWFFSILICIGILICFKVPLSYVK